MQSKQIFIGAAAAGLAIAAALWILDTDEQQVSTVDIHRTVQRKPLALSQAGLTESQAGVPGQRALPPALSRIRTSKSDVMPTSSLTGRFTSVVEALPEDARPSEITWSCTEPDLCEISGIINSNIELAILLKALEDNEVQGSDEIPTVDLMNTELADELRTFTIQVSL